MPTQGVFDSDSSNEGMYDISLISLAWTKISTANPSMPQMTAWSLDNSNQKSAAKPAADVTPTPKSKMPNTV